MAVPKDFLLETIRNEGGESTLLDHVISVFCLIAGLDEHDIVRKSAGMGGDHGDSSSKYQSYSEMEVMDYTLQNEHPNDRSGHNTIGKMKSWINSNDSKNADVNAVKLSAKLILMHFLSFMGHFPIPKLSTSSLCAVINEADDGCANSQNCSDKIDLETINSPNVQAFVVGDNCLVSFVELSPDAMDSTIMEKLYNNLPGGQNVVRKPVRIIIRNLLGRFVWDCLSLESIDSSIPRPLLPARKRIDYDLMSNRTTISVNGRLQDVQMNEDDEDDDEENEKRLNSLQKDSLEHLMDNICHSSPECGKILNDISNSFLQSFNSTSEACDMVALFTNQHYKERQFNEQARYSSPKNVAQQSNLNVNKEEGVAINDDKNNQTDISKAFRQCRQLIEQLGFLTWDTRKNINLLSKSQSMLRELRNLDGQRCRETHKIAVIYVASGQETKDQILLNKTGSKAFEEFVSQLGWEVNLANHNGFMGGLESNLSTGLTAPYFADSFNEVIFHVSTRLEPAQGHADANLDKNQLMTKKMRHLGNDEVHIVWSEHFKDYRRTILSTQFCDALIVIYPLKDQNYQNLFRIYVSRKKDVEFFGPLFSGIVVHRDELAALIRTTAINASRAKRLNMSAYKQYFEERFDGITSIANKHRQKDTFEGYACKVYAPRCDLLPKSNNYGLSSESCSIDYFLRTSQNLLASISGHQSGSYSADAVSLSSATETGSLNANEHISNASTLSTNSADSLSHPIQSRGSITLVSPSSRPISRSSIK